jgi:hypothetical protein
VNVLVKKTHLFDGLFLRSLLLLLKETLLLLLGLLLRSLLRSRGSLWRLLKPPYIYTRGKTGKREMSFKLSVLGATS